MIYLMRRCLICISTRRPPFNNKQRHKTKPCLQFAHTYSLCGMCVCTLIRRRPMIDRARNAAEGRANARSLARSRTLITAKVNAITRDVQRARHQSRKFANVAQPERASAESHAESEGYVVCCWCWAGNELPPGNFE